MSDRRTHDISQEDYPKVEGLLVIGTKCSRGLRLVLAWQ